MQYRLLILPIALSMTASMDANPRLKTIVNTTNLTDSSRVFDIEEVVVVSQPKDAFHMRMQPLSSSSFSKTQMSSIGVRDLRDISSFVPSFAMPSYGSRLTSSMYVRGIGSRVNDPAVGIYVDGIPLICKSAYNSHLYQIDRVDVLRGPQGTLYGQNTEGGLVRMYSHNPMDGEKTEVRLGWGTHFHRNIEFAHYGKASDELAYSIAGFYNGQNGFFRNQNTGCRADAFNEAGGRTRVVFQPTDKLSLDWVADYQYVNQKAFPYGLLDESTGVASMPSTTFDGKYRRNMFNTGLTLKYDARFFSINSTTSYQFLSDNMHMDQDYTAANLMSLEQKQLQNAITEELTLKGIVLDMWHYTFGLFGAYQWLKTNAPVGFGKDMTDKIAQPIHNAMLNAMVNSMAKPMIDKGMPEDIAKKQALEIIDKAGGVSLDIGMAVPGVFRTPHFNLGIFHESNIDISPNPTATLGLRYDYSHKKIAYDTEAMMAITANVMGKTATNVLTSILNNSVSDDFNQLLPKAGLTFRFKNGSNIYAVVSKGYRSGGYNIQMFSDILQTELNNNKANAMGGNYEVPHDANTYDKVNKTIAYNPETSWNYEIGAHINLIGSLLHLDMSAYLMHVRNQQLSVMAGNYGFGRMMVNAGRSRSLGAEAMLQGCAIDNRLTWSVSYGMADATFREYIDNVTVNGQETEINYRGKRVPYVPRHTIGAFVDYRHDFNSSALRSLTIGINANAQGRIYWDEANTYSQKLYSVIGAHIDADFGIVGLSVWGRNLFDAHYNTFAIASSASGEKLFFGERSAPHQIGVDLKINL